jgi:hypothetical protein
MYNFPEITIASMDESFFRGGCKSIKLEKSASSSRLFLSIMKQSSLIVCSDSGPLHIALSLNKNLIAYMRSTKPQDVINTGSSVLINIEN